MASGGWRWHKKQSGRNALGSFNSPSLTNVPEEHRSHFATIFSPLLLLKLLGHQANLILIVNHRSSSTLALWPFLSSCAQSSKPLTSDSWEGGIWSFSGKISDYAGITLCVRATQDKFTEEKKRSSMTVFVEMDCSAAGGKISQSESDWNSETDNHHTSSQTIQDSWY